MKSQKYKKFIKIIFVVIIIYFLPLWIITLTTITNIISTIDELPQSDSVIIFGTLIQDENKISPLLKERLESGKAIYIAKKVKNITVSNTQKATDIMTKYLQEENINLDSIELDKQAVTTADTCNYEKQQHPESRKVIFVSQRFHLPRLIYQCRKIGIEGIGFPAENINITNRSQYSLITKVIVKTKRYFREAGLTWLVILKMY